MEEDRGVRRFRPPKTEEEERLLLDSTVPKNTQHNTKWAVKVFEEWQSSRRDKAPRQLASSLTALYLTNIPDLITPLGEMNAGCLNLWFKSVCRRKRSNKVKCVWCCTRLILLLLFKVTSKFYKVQCFHTGICGCILCYNHCTSGCI